MRLAVVPTPSSPSLHYGPDHENIHLIIHFSSSLGVNEWAVRAVRARATGRVGGLVLTSRFLAILTHFKVLVSHFGRVSRCINCWTLSFFKWHKIGWMHSRYWRPKRGPSSAAWQNPLLLDAEMRSKNTWTWKIWSTRRWFFVSLFRCDYAPL